MTDRVIVATFPNSNSAYEAAGALKKLKDTGAVDFKIKTGVMIEKDDRGNVHLLEEKGRKPWETGVGTASGAIIGLIGGAPGAAIGAAIGAMAGLSGDTVTAALDSDFVESVTNEMKPGMSAIVVEADEQSTRPVDDLVALKGGHVYRQTLQ
jgi:uncharacterized membrane protein